MRLHNDKIGTTGKGIGPVYTDKTSRNGLRVGDILHNFQEKYDKAVERHKEMLDNCNFNYDNLAELERSGLKVKKQNLQYNR